MSKDYYKILEIEEFETAENIKAAYRKLARKWHPDIAGNTPEVLTRFKEITEAYQILSDNVKKSEYDRVRRFYQYAKSGAESDNSKINREKNEENFEKHEKTTNPNKKQQKRFGFNWEEFISKKQKENSYEKNNKPEPIKGKDIYADIEISITEAISGTEKTVNILQTQTCPKCGGRKFANGSVCGYCFGSGEETRHKKFNVKIPAGIKNNSKIRLSEEGSKGQNGGKNGDLYITVKIAEPKEYKIDGLNIHKTVAIAPYEAVLGTTVTLTTLDGNISLKIAPNTQNGQKFRLSGCGISQNNSIGDMIVTVEIKISANLTEEEVNLYKKLAEISSDNIRGTNYDRQSKN